MATKISAAELHLRVGEILAKIRHTGERFVIERRGVPIAAIVTLNDLKRLELEDPEHRSTKEERLAALAQANSLRALILARRDGNPLPDSSRLLEEIREERERELTGLH
jgi:antitoxin (DNA-binding transcriptional repressor) of toxin-antitoxin stability system